MPGEVNKLFKNKNKTMSESLYEEDPVAEHDVGLFEVHCRRSFLTGALHWVQLSL